MAKALIGHVSRSDPRVSAELFRLRQRVRDLETEIDRLRRASDAAELSRLDRLDGEGILALSVDDMPAGSAAAPEPALT